MFNEDESDLKEFFKRQSGVRRVYGGLAWPYGLKPGFLLVVSEDYELDQGIEERPFRVKAEIEESSLETLYRRCQDLQGTHRVETWYGDTKNPMKRVWDEFNREQSNPEKLVYVHSAAYFDDPKALVFYLQLLKDLLRPERKLLHFGENSKLPGYLTQLTPDDMQNGTFEYPAIAALGYAVAALRIWKPAEDNLGRPEYADTQYDMFGR